MKNYLGCSGEGGMKYAKVASPFFLNVVSQKSILQLISSRKRDMGYEVGKNTNTLEGPISWVILNGHKVYFKFADFFFASYLNSLVLWTVSYSFCFDWVA